MENGQKSGETDKTGKKPSFFTGRMRSISSASERSEMWIFISLTGVLILTILGVIYFLTLA